MQISLYYNTIDFSKYMIICKFIKIIDQSNHIKSNIYICMEKFENMGISMKDYNYMGISLDCCMGINRKNSCKVRYMSLSKLMISMGKDNYTSSLSISNKVHYMWLLNNPAQHSS